MKKITIGIIAHVDSGKTTLSEALLYLTGTIRNFGRVDKGASFLDDNVLERKRGITIYSKQARFQIGDTEVTLIDTPGHADFSAETERALQVLDYAVLLISAADGVRGQTQNLWHLLGQYRIPTILFVNKMDQDGADRTVLYQTLRLRLSEEIVDATDFLGQDPGTISSKTEEFYDAAAMCKEKAMEHFLETQSIPDEMLQTMIAGRDIFPCVFGSALRQQGVTELLALLDRFTLPGQYSDAFGARVYKILRDPTDGSRVTLLKVTGGSLKNKTALPDGHGESKINQIRFYNGNKFTLAETAAAGEVCAVTGLKESYAGQGFGAEAHSPAPLLIPILSYRVILPDSMDPIKALPVFRELEEETPELSVSWEEEGQHLSVCVMGEVQLEILTSLLRERYHMEVTFDQGEVLYKETISAPVIGSGHFEPLRHYAEAHFLLEPLPLGSGLQFVSDVSTDQLAKNWQRLILTHLEERVHKGVLTGSPVTDMRITLIAGKAHLKHTEGGDFRQAVYRAVRQGLMMADSVLLEPYYRFTLEVPSANIGRAMNDLNQKDAEFSVPELSSASFPGDMEQSVSVITGRGPVSRLKDYPRELAAYTKGQGRLQLMNDGYDVCRNAQEVILRKGYDPQTDLRNTPDSVFCANGSSFIVPYDQAYSYMDLSPWDPEAGETEELKTRHPGSGEKEIHIGTEEIDAILARVSRSNSKDKKPENHWKRKFSAKDGLSRGSAIHPQGAGGREPSSGRSRIFSLEEAEYILVDGYNVIFAWPELSELARVNIDSARDSLLDTLGNFAALLQGEVRVIFDAYRVRGHQTERLSLPHLQVFFTGEEETADQFIEKFTNEYGRKYKIAVVTSDGLEQIITRGQGCILLSSRDLKAYIERQSATLRERYGVKPSF